MNWARDESQRTLTGFQADRRYQSFYDRALQVLQARDRIPNVTIRPHGLYNFWQDESHTRGILRRTTLASYRTDSPEWQTVLDIDALARTEGRSWVYQGMNCLAPEQRRCLVFLSDGGRDANVVREFDLVEGRFVEGGFSLPEGKQNVTWADENTLARRARLGRGDDDLVRLSLRRAAAAPRAAAWHRRSKSIAASPATCRSSRSPSATMPGGCTASARSASATSGSGRPWSSATAAMSCSTCPRALRPPGSSTGGCSSS